MPERRHGPARYVAAIVATAIALPGALVFQPVISRIPSTLVFVAVMVSAWYGGFGPGLLATGLGVLAAAYFLFPPKPAFWPMAADDLLALAVLAVLGVVASALTARARTVA